MKNLQLTCSVGRFGFQGQFEFPRGHFIISGKMILLVMTLAFLQSSAIISVQVSVEPERFQILVQISRYDWLQRICIILNKEKFF